MTTTNYVIPHFDFNFERNSTFFVFAVPILDENTRCECQIVWSKIVICRRGVRGFPNYRRLMTKGGGRSKIEDVFNERSLTIQHSVKYKFLTIWLQTHKINFFEVML